MKKINIIMFILMFTWVTMLAAVEVPGPHSTWDGLLKKHVQNGRVDYRGFHADRFRLNRYLRQLEKTDLSSYSPRQKLAFWINAYNAFTIKLILNHYPVKSIRKISRPWKRRIWKAAGKTVSLDEIEHRILRKQFKEPRIHFAIVCASIGCPDLQDFAYVPGKIEEQLSLAARQFFGSQKHFYIEGEGNTVKIHISKIFKWFGEDFGKSKKERAAFMQEYLDKTTAAKIKKAASLKFKYLSYDWSLNRQ